MHTDAGVVMVISIFGLLVLSAIEYMAKASLASLNPPNNANYYVIPQQNIPQQQTATNVEQNHDNQSNAVIIALLEKLTSQQLNNQQQPVNPKCRCNQGCRCDA